MWKLIAINLMIIGISFGRFTEKTRYDRAMDFDVKLQDLEEKKEDRTTFTDYETQYIAYKDAEDDTCYLEKIKKDRLKAVLAGTYNARVLYPSSQSLTELEGWKLAGGRIVDFCRGKKMKVLQEFKEIPSDTQDPFYNELPIDENDIFQKRINDVVLTPLRERAKREILTEQREKINNDLLRSRRQASPNGKARFHGQTQSQYLSNDAEKEGKAEAEATNESSHALVSESIVN